MQITSFNISADRTQLDVVIIDALDISSLKLWTNSTYKDFSKAIDLSTKLTASATENITITLSDIGETYFDGVYFLEAEDTDEVSTAITSDLTRYNECLINKVVEINLCEDCKNNNTDSINTIHTLIDSLDKAIINGFVSEILIFTKALDKLCSNDCNSCGQRDNITDTDYFSSND